MTLGSNNGACPATSKSTWHYSLGAFLATQLLTHGLIALPPNSNVMYPIHPLDVVSPSLLDPTICTGTFVPQYIGGGGE
jgi:hypothetical protein